MPTVAEALVAFVALYPVVTAAVWIAGGVLFRLREEENEPARSDTDWPGVTVLLPAYNEAAVIATSVGAALAADYPELEIVVLDDGSTDGTETAAQDAAAGDPRFRVVRDPVNRGKADRLNAGFELASHDLVIVTDADTHMHPAAIRLLVSRMLSSPLLAAVAGAPHVTNRNRFICTMQVLETASIIGLIRRTQAVTGRVGVVAGVLGLFRRDRVLAVGGFDPRMATEDIDLTWKLLLAGWHTTYEPRALVGMQVPSTLHALWAQRTRWARGQGEVIRAHGGRASHWRNHRLWLLSIESVASLIWVVALAASLVVTLLGLAFSDSDHLLGLGLAWGVSISVVATLQLFVALCIDSTYDPREWWAFLLGPVYPLAYWVIAAAAALRAQTVALARGPRGHRVVWDIPREPVA